MAPADAGDYRLDEDDDDFFEEYNAHPYRGGYDLAATYGNPLPPSAKTCYPASTSASPAAALPTAPSPAPKPADPPPEETFDKGEEAREPLYESPEVALNGAGREGKARRRGWCGFRRKCVRWLDYLFCYKDPYKEQQIGVDSYVVPVYANRKESGEDALASEVKVVPSAVVEAHSASEELLQSNDFSWHYNYIDEADAYSWPMKSSYCGPSFAQLYGLPSVSENPDWFLNFSFLESHQVEESKLEASLSYDVGHTISCQPIHCYHHRCYEQPQNVQVDPPEQFSSEKLEYNEAYNIQSYTQISDVPFEPFESSWSQNWNIYHAYTQGYALECETNSLVSSEYGDIGSLFVSPFYPQETKTFEQVHSDEHVSFQQNWQNSSYWNMPMDNISLITQPAANSYNMNGSFWPFGENSAYNV